MQQVLFTIPDPFGFFPDGIPIYGFGLMLFLTFVTAVWYTSKRVPAIGLSPDRMQDIILVIFVSGIIGARIVYMIQYGKPIGEFFRFWEGGIVFYGSALGGWCGYWLFYYFVLRKYQISTWKLADIVAPTVCIGLAIGRVGCLLNGCCYGHVVDERSIGLHFPMLTAPSRDLMLSRGWQTTLGFSPAERDLNDPRTVVDKIEPDSEALRSGLKEKDRIIRVNGQANTILVLAAVPPDRATELRKALDDLKVAHTPLESPATEIAMRIIVGWPEQLLRVQETVRAFGGDFRTIDYLTDRVRNWPKGTHQLQFAVERDGAEVELPAYTPRTLGLHPTQVYETISMLLLLFLLLAYHPFRRHDGQVFVLMMIGYAIHRFINESLRNDTEVVAFGMTLSMNISIGIILAAGVLELWLRWTQPKRTAV